MFARGLAEGEERNCLTGKRFSVGVTEITENETEVVIAHTVNTLNATVLFPLEWLI